MPWFRSAEGVFPNCSGVQPMPGLGFRDTGFRVGFGHLPPLQGLQPAISSKGHHSRKKEVRQGSPQCCGIDSAGLLPRESGRGPEGRNHALDEETGPFVLIPTSSVRYGVETVQNARIAGA